MLRHGPELVRCLLEKGEFHEMETPVENLVLAVIAAGFTAYPAFTQPRAVIETLTDKGLIVEMIVKCPDGAGIITYSKVEQRYCTPDFACYGTVKPAIRHLCD